MSEPIVSVSGLRGIVGDSFTPDVLVAYVAAYADLLKKKKVVVGGDSRPSRSWAQPVVESVLRARGVEVISIGLAPTPTIGMMTRLLKAGGAIAITASHNPIEWNGLKFFQASGEFLTAEMAEELKRRVARPTGVSVKGVGARTPFDEAFTLHLNQLTKALPPLKSPRAVKVVLDCCNATASLLGPRVVATYGGQQHSIFVNPLAKFPRGAEPLPQNLKALRREVKIAGADFGAAFDPDADRLALVDEQGRAIGEERTLVLALDAYFELTGKKTNVAVNLSTSMAVDALAAKRGFRVFRSKIGEAHVLAAIRANRCAIGGEGNGGVIWPAVHPGRDAATAVALVLQGLQRRGGTLSEWNATIPDYQMVKGKIEAPRAELPKLLKAVRREFADAHSVDELDGMKFLFADSWIQLRASNTEPIVRVFAEGRERGEALRLVGRVEKLLK